MGGDRRTATGRDLSVDHGGNGRVLLLLRSPDTRGHSGRVGGQSHRASLVGTNVFQPSPVPGELRRLAASVPSWPVRGWVVEPGSVGERGRRLFREEGPLYIAREEDVGVDTTLDIQGRISTIPPAWCPPDLYQRP